MSADPYRLSLYIALCYLETRGNRINPLTVDAGQLYPRTRDDDLVMGVRGCDLPAHLLCIGCVYNYDQGTPRLSTLDAGQIDIMIPVLLLDCLQSCILIGLDSWDRPVRSRISDMYMTFGTYFLAILLVCWLTLESWKRHQSLVRW